MRRIFTLLFVAFSVSMFAQSLSVVSSVDTVYCDPNSAADFDAKIVVKNESSAAADFKVKRSGTFSDVCLTNYFCWDLCYLPQDDVSTGSLNITAGATNNWFSGHVITPGDGLESCCTIRYTFFNVADANDTLSVDVTFCATNAFSVEEEISAISSVYPNPVKNILNIKLNNVQVGSEFQILNVVGQVVKNVPVQQNQDIMTVNVSDLNPGIYFYSLNVNGKSVETKRLIVSK